MRDRSLPGLLRAELARQVPDLARLPEGVWKRTGALNTWGTNAIEGNTLSLQDVERVLMEGESIAGRPVPEVMETVQHEQAFRGLLARRGSPISLVAVLELHETVFRGIPRYRPGQWRTSNVMISGTRYRPPGREKVLQRMIAWESEYFRRQLTKDVFEIGAWMHHEFESVHPFEDGNGRVGRLVLNLHFLRKGWPPLHVLPDDRKEYLDCLETGHVGSCEQLTAFLRLRMARSILDLLDQVGGPEHRLVELRKLARERWNPYGAHYLALRARQTALLAIRVTNRIGPEGQRRKRGRPAWLSSEFALRHYISAAARQDP